MIKILKFKIHDIVRISEYKKIFGKGHISNQSLLLFRGHMSLVILNARKLLNYLLKRITKNK